MSKARLWTGPPAPIERRLVEQVRRNAEEAGRGLDDLSVMDRWTAIVTETGIEVGAFYIVDDIDVESLFGG